MGALRITSITCKFDNVFSFSQNLYRLASEGNGTRMTQIERIYTDKIIKIVKICVIRPIRVLFATQPIKLRKLRDIT